MRPGDGKRQAESGADGNSEFRNAMERETEEEKEKKEEGEEAAAGAGDRKSVV